MKTFHVPCVEILLSVSHTLLCTVLSQDSKFKDKILENRLLLFSVLFSGFLFCLSVVVVVVVVVVDVVYFSVLFWFESTSSYKIE